MFNLPSLDEANRFTTKICKCAEPRDCHIISTSNAIMHLYCFNIGTNNKYTIVYKPINILWIPRLCQNDWLKSHYDNITIFIFANCVQCIYVYSGYNIDVVLMLIYSISYSNCRYGCKQLIILIPFSLVNRRKCFRT